MSHRIIQMNISIIIGFMALVLLSGCSTYYKGPQSDHFDGKEFTPIHERKISRWDVLKWKLASDSQSVDWPEWVDYGATTKPDQRIEGSEMVATFVNHATVLLQTEGVNILIDPVWSERVSPVQWAGPKRIHAPGIKFEDLPPIDIVLISHNHYDHMDKETIKRLYKRDNPHFIVPLGNDTILRNFAKDIHVTALDWKERLRPESAPFDIILEPAYHWSARGLFDRNKALWGGFVLDSQHGSIYYTGDTAYSNGEVFKEIGSTYDDIRLALIPIGAYEPRWFMKYSHTNPEESVQIFNDVNAGHAIGVHFGAFKLTDEGYDDPPRDLKDAIDKDDRVDEDDFRVLKPGEQWNVPLL